VIVVNRLPDFLENFETGRQVLFTLYVDFSQQSGKEKVQVSRFAAGTLALGGSRGHRIEVVSSNPSTLRIGAQKDTDRNRLNHKDLRT
jgi:hypothetical protein